MATESFTPHVPDTVQGTGPYTFPSAYSRAADLVVNIRTADDTLIILPAADWSITPEASETGGDITLSTSAAALYDGATLTITRSTLVEQGWQGTGGAREEGLEAQLDILARAQQDAQQFGLRAIRMPADFQGQAPTFPTPSEGFAPIWGPDGTLINGPDAADIAAAQANAAAAAQSAQEAAQSAAAADTFDPANYLNITDLPAARSQLQVSRYGAGIDVRDIFGTLDFDLFLEGGVWTLAGSIANGPDGAGASTYNGILEVVQRSFTTGIRIVQRVYSDPAVTPDVSQLNSVWQRVGTGSPATWSAWQFFPASIDEDDFASNSDTLVPTQQSVKVYVDSRRASSGRRSIAGLADDTVTGIPPGVVDLTIHLYRISLSGTGDFEFQLRAKQILDFRNGRSSLHQTQTVVRHPAFLPASSFKATMPHTSNPAG